MLCKRLHLWFIKRVLNEIQCYNQLSRPEVWARWAILAQTDYTQHMTGSDVPGNDTIPHILVVDDEALASRMYAFILQEAEIGHARQCTDSRDVMDILDKESVDLVLLDLNMPYIGGRELLEKMAAAYPEIPVIILTNEDRIEVAVECMKIGAFDFMTKPVDRNRLISAVRHGLTIRELKREVSILSTRREERFLANPEAFASIITQSANMKTVFAYIEAVARSPKAILITGESGTGKELIAKVIHNLSGRSGRFVPINVSGLDDTIFSDSLFGHLRGSYTGADSVRKGLVEHASEGTLFMDEIGDMESGPQIKLLRLLQEGEYYPLGSDSPQKSRARIVAATNADLNDKQKSGIFRRDLYFRLIAHHIELPPLRERKEDIPLLLEHFVADAATTLGRGVPRVPDAVIRILSQYDFPGNVRELQGLSFDAVSRSSGPNIDTTLIHDYVLEHQPDLADSFGPLVLSEPHEPLAKPAISGDQPDFSGIDQAVDKQQKTSKLPLPDSANNAPTAILPADWTKGPGDLLLGRELPMLQAATDFLFTAALIRSDGNQSLAAAMLGISQSTLSRWLHSHKS